MLGVGAAGPIGEHPPSLEAEAVTAHREPAPGVVRPAPDGTPERDAWAVLSAVNGLGPVALGALLDRHGTGLAVLHEAATTGGIARLAEVPLDRPGLTRAPRRLGKDVAEAIATAAQRAPQTLARIHSLGLRVVTVADDSYPSRLAAIEMPPHVLFVLGDPAAMETRAAVAIVGTRRATDAGRAISAQLARNLVAVGASVVSGLAVGIDGAAHAAAVDAHGTTVAVIGSGHAVLHPAVHSRLAARIVASGGAVVSELPPDLEATKGTFPRRNRIISGLADATVVVEAPARSGALITASWALEQGRECFIVPGPLGAAASEGCLAFLREFSGSAHIVAGIPQLLDDLGLADRLAEPGVSGSAAATLADVGPAAGTDRPRTGPRASHGRRTRRGHRLARGDDPGRSDRARTAGSGGRCPRPVPARRRTCVGDPQGGHGRADRNTLSVRVCPSATAGATLTPDRLPQDRPCPVLAHPQRTSRSERLLHKAAVALLAVPVLAVVYLGALLRRSTLARASLAIGLAIVLGAGVVGATRPTVTVATPPTVVLPLTQGEFQTTVTTDRAVAEPVTISFRHRWTPDPSRPRSSSTHRPPSTSPGTPRARS